MLSRFSRVCVTPWTAAHQAPPSKGFSRQEYWSGLPMPSPIATVCIHFFFEVLHKVHKSYTLSSVKTLIYMQAHIFSFHLYSHYPNEDRCFQDARGLPHVLPLILWYLICLKFIDNSPFKRWSLFLS